MRYRRRQGSTGTARSVAGQIMGLSLFIMLLAFFIVLNSMSDYEESKTRPVIESLGEAFSSDVEKMSVDDYSSVMPTQETSRYEGTTIERLSALFSAQIPGHQSVLNHRQGTMIIQIPFQEFEEAVFGLEMDDGRQSSAQNFFLSMLVALVKNDQTGGVYHMDIVLNVTENPANLQNNQPRELSSLMKTMSQVAQKIEAAGLPTKLMSVGLQKGRADTVEILFRRHIPFNPLDHVEKEGTRDR